jgi:hypothetical protein
MPFAGNINLSTGEVDVQETDQELLKHYFAGRVVWARCKHLHHNN